MSFNESSLYYEDDIAVVQNEMPILLHPKVN